MKHLVINVHLIMLILINTEKVENILKLMNLQISISKRF